MYTSMNQEGINEQGAYLVALLFDPCLKITARHSRAQSSSTAVRICTFGQEKSICVCSVLIYTCVCRMYIHMCVGRH
jgi:hypothetical protein